MSGRDPDPKKTSARPGFLGRTKAMNSGGSSGWEATTIGFTLVGCIGAGAGLGYFLDSHFKTNYWLPILFLVGVLAGFREMFLVLGRISKEQEQQKLEKQQQVRVAPTPTSGDVTKVEPPGRERIFQVPPPPKAGEKIAQSRTDEPESVEDLMERLLEDDRKDDTNENENELDGLK